MTELLRSNDLVLLSYVEALLAEAGVEHLILDHNMSALEGSLGILPRRVLVAKGDLARARRRLVAAGLGHELSDADDGRS